MIPSASWGIVFHYPGQSITRHSTCIYMLYPVSLIFQKFVQNCYYFSFLCNLCVCFVICPSVSCSSSHVFHLCCFYSSGVPCFNSPKFRINLTVKDIISFSNKDQGRTFVKMIRKHSVSTAENFLIISLDGVIRIFSLT
jgi:hypothetical protein